jgi:hypothetical protein
MSVYLDFLQLSKSGEESFYRIKQDGVNNILLHQDVLANNCLVS